MTHYSHKFSTYTPCPSNRKITIADGSFATIAGQGDIHLSPFLILKNVLHVPKLTTNLVSIQQLTKTLNCYLTFLLTSCVFQDQVSGKMIRHAKEKSGLHYLELLAENVKTMIATTSSLLSETSSIKNQI